MRGYRGGEIVLLSFPFVDATGARRRPALVLLDTGDDDIIVARVTSQPPRTSFDVVVTEWQQAGLLVPSVVRLDKLATLEKRLVGRQLGGLTPDDWRRVTAMIRYPRPPFLQTGLQHVEKAVNII